MIGKLLMDDHEATEGLTALELPDDVNEKVTALSREGDALAKAGRYAEAKQAYLQALPLLPDNPNQWTAAAWLYVAIGDASFHHGLYDEAFDAFFQAVQCQGDWAIHSYTYASGSCTTKRATSTRLPTNSQGPTWGPGSTYSAKTTLGLPRFDGHPRSGAGRAPGGCPASWRAWERS
ncbi:tetratricopeptide repeat protein, partial [Actinoplanes sp. NPDC048796]|uniref:tetratricopeptide repeat protein n=1 Tax=Actinoplanes sp. NPDC048796 TaxID=3155640 RepID=UPI0033C6B629